MSGKQVAGRMPEVMVIDDEKNILEMIGRALPKNRYRVVTESDPAAALAAMDAVPPDVVISDIKMPGTTGLDILRAAKKANPSVNVILITAYASVETAVEAIRGGAFDYLTKPFKIQDLRDSVARAASAKRIDTMAGKTLGRELVAQSTGMREIVSLIGRVAVSDCTVLIAGESGTGKELVAQTIHARSPRAQRPFVSINCAALPESLLASELFGYEKGAFTGADKQKIGLVEYADGGTLLLDEVGDMSANLQLKLLRVLQEREIKRVGGVETLPVNVRIIAASNKTLKDEVAAGRFREDLFYRLNVVPVVLPPLRERPEDIDALVHEFLHERQQKAGTERTVTFDAAAWEVIRAYPWPGNVRELEHFIERIWVMTTEPVITRDILSSLFHEMFGAAQSAGMSRRANKRTISFRDEKAAFERDLITDTLKKTNGNKYQAAKLLNLTRQNLQYKLKKYGLQ